MTHREFPAGKDPAFLFGCGRFRMEPNLLERSAEEILRFGRRPLLVCDDRSHAVAFDKVAASLAAAGVELRELRHNGFCCRDDALACAEAGALEGADVVLGCGGGVICDFSKCIAHLAGAPLVTIPTSSAQCCAFTPIAVCYTREGRYVSTTHFPGEIASALLDTTVLSRQPARLLAAGALDAMAKKIELAFWTQLDRMAPAGAAAASAATSSAAAASSSSSPPPAASTVSASVVLQSDATARKPSRTDWSRSEESPSSPSRNWTTTSPDSSCSASVAPRAPAQ